MEEDTQTIIQVKELPIDFIGTGEVKGFHFHQMKKTKKGYIYEVMSDGVINPWYEVFQRKESWGVMFDEEKNKLCADKTRKIVSYPRSGQFGLTAWSCANMEHAERVFNERIENKPSYIRKSDTFFPQVDNLSTDTEKMQN